MEVTNRDNAINVLMHYMAKYQELRSLLTEFNQDEYIYLESVSTDGNYVGKTCVFCNEHQDKEFYQERFKHSENCLLVRTKKALENNE